MDLYIHSSRGLHGVGLSSLSTETTLAFASKLETLNVCRVLRHSPVSHKEQDVICCSLQYLTVSDNTLTRLHSVIEILYFKQQNILLLCLFHLMNVT
jgi:hypothetical protein